MGRSAEEVERLVVTGDIKMTRDNHGTPRVSTPLPATARLEAGGSPRT